MDEWYQYIIKPKPSPLTKDIDMTHDSEKQSFFNREVASGNKKSTTAHLLFTSSYKRSFLKRMR